MDVIDSPSMWFENVVQYVVDILKSRKQVQQVFLKETKEFAPVLKVS